MKKTLIACLIASIVATSLTGCGKSQEELKKEADLAAYHQMLQDQERQKKEDAEAAALAAEQNAADDKELADVVAELKKGDPLVRDAYYGYNEKGDRVLHVIRDNPPQPAQQQAGYGQPQYQQGSNGQPVIINNQPAASSGVSETIWPLVAGAGAGMLLANAMNNNGGFDRYRDSHPGYSNRYYNDDNEYRRQRTTVVNQYHTTNIRNVTTTYKNPESPAAKAYQAQTGYKPAKVAPSASNYTQTRAAASPTARQYEQPKVAAKPLTNPQVNSYWSQPKAEPAKPAAQASNSYWGNTAKASPAAATNQTRQTNTYKASPSPARTSFSRPSGRR